jgi:energy-converting hydrogenase Eha subunit C
MLMLLVTFTLLCAPDTPTGRFLHRHLVVAVARRLDRVTAGHVLLMLTLCAVATLVIALMRGDGLAMLGMMAPEASSWLITIEASSYLDIAAAVVLAAATVRMRGLRGAWRGARRRPLRRGAGMRRARRTRRPAPRIARNDDEGERRFAA